jgi:hypothetical protein
VIDAGLPAAVWAGIATLGDGGHQPIAARERRPVPARSLGAVAIAIAIGSTVWIRYRRGRHQAPSFLLKRRGGGRTR